MASDRRKTRALLTAAILVFPVAPCAAGQPRAPHPGAPEEELQVPPVAVTAPARLPGDPLPFSSIPATVHIISGEALRASGAVTLQDALTSLAGVTLNDQQGNPFQLDLSLRGFAATPVTGIPQGLSVFLDGVRINEPSAEEVNFDLIPLEDIEHIELIRGPSPLFGRNTLGGAVNLITRRGRVEKEVLADAEGGSFGRQKYRIRAGGKEGPIDYHLAGSFFREDGWRDASESWLGKAFGKLGYLGQATDATLSYQYVQNRIEQPGSLPPGELAQDRTRNFTAGDFFRPALHLGTANLRHRLGQGLLLSLNGFGRRLEAEQFNVNLVADNTRLSNATASAGGTAQLTHEGKLLGRQNILVGGLEYVRHWVHVRVVEEKNERTLAACIQNAIAAGQDPAVACPLRRLSAKLQDRQDAAALYLQETLDLAKDALLEGDRLVLTASLRWDWLRHHVEDQSPVEAGRPRASGTSTFSRANPRLGLNYNPSRDMGFFFAYAQGFRAPAFLELACAGPGAVCPGLQAGVAPDPPLKPVRARSYEVGLRASPAAWLEGQLSLFRTDAFDEISSVSPTGTTGVFFQNVGSTRRQGLELSLRASAKGRWDAYANYSLMEATFQDDLVLATPQATPGCAAPPCAALVRRGNYLPLVPNHRVNAGVQYHPTGWLTLSLSGVYVGEQRLRGDEANSGGKLSGYLMVNGGVEARWRKLVASLWISNVLNNRYETFGTFAPNAKLPGAPVQPFLTPAPPIRFLGGASYRF